MAEVDPGLIARCQAGDRAALELIYRRHVARVWRFAMLRARNRDDAAEIVQETFLRVVEHIGRFEQRSTFATWLYSIARSVSVDLARRKRRDDKLREPGIIRLSEVRKQAEREEASPARTPAARESHSADGGSGRRNPATAGTAPTSLLAHIPLLPAAQRDAIVLFELMDLSIRECAAVLGWTEGRVKSTLLRARRRLALARQSDPQRTADEGICEKP